GRWLLVLGNRERGVVVVAEHYRLGGVEVHGDDVELDLAETVEHAEIVRHAPPLDVVAEVVFETRVVEHTGGQVGEREGELLCRADGVDQGLGTLDEVPERRPSAGASERLLQTAHQRRGRRRCRSPWSSG